MGDEIGRVTLETRGAFNGDECGDDGDDYSRDGFVVLARVGHTRFWWASRSASTFLTGECLVRVVVVVVVAATA